MSRPNDDYDIEAFALHDLMERVRDYLAAGRRHANLSDHDLLGYWEQYFWAFMVNPSPELTASFEGLDAERELRGLRAPEVRFSQRDRARIHRTIREAAACPEVRARIAADYEEFRRQWHGPGH
jgi:hypothetical protein